MTRKFLYTSLSIFLLSLVFFSCSARYSKDQIRFGIEAAQMQLWDEAIFRWKKVISLEPNNSSAHNNLAVAYENKGMFEEAENEYLKALDLDPDNERIQSNYEKFKQDIEQKNNTEKKDEIQDKKEKKNEK